MLNGVHLVKGHASVSHSVTQGHRSPGHRLTARGTDGNR